MAKDSYIFNADTNTIRFPNGVELDLNKVSEANNKRAALHGWHARINDTAAIGMADKDGNIIPKAQREEMKYHRMNELCAFYESGTEDWSRKGDGEGGLLPIAVEAFARHMGCDSKEARERMEAVAKSMNRTWEKQCAVTRALFPDEVKAIQAERDARKPKVEGIDLAAELAALKG